MPTRREDELLEALEHLPPPASTPDPPTEMAPPRQLGDRRLAALSGRGGERARVSLMRFVQRGSGNQTAVRIMRQAEAGEEDAASADVGEVFSLEEDFMPEEYTDVPDQHEMLATVDSGGAQSAEEASASGGVVAAPRVGFVDAGRIGRRRYGDPEDGPRHAPRAFVNGGQTGTVVWAGGGGAGARGNEGAGTIQSQVAPIYDSAANATPPRFDGWIHATTGTITVTRSYLGINAGDQGNGHFVTAGAAARINAHEVLHVTSSSGFYATHLTPLEARVAAYARGGSGVNIGTSAVDAQAKVKTAVNWAATVTAFQKADRAANQPGGPVDTADKNSGTYPVDAGPGTVAGTAFAHRIRLPGEANPAP